MKIGSIILLCLIGALGVAKEPEGWQFYGFFGNYEVIEGTSSCEHLNGTVFVGFLYTKTLPSLEIRSRFSTGAHFHAYLRNSSSHGQDCYECDPDSYDSETISGHGLKNAVYTTSGIQPYNHRPYSATVELVRGEGYKVFIKWNECTATLKKTIGEKPK